MSLLPLFAGLFLILLGALITSGARGAVVLAFVGGLATAAGVVLLVSIAPELAL